MLTAAELLSMDYQVMFNIVLGGFGFLAGVLITNIWKEIKQLQTNERETTKRIGEIEVLVAGHYVTRTEFTHVMDKVIIKLDVIADSISHKADKP
jgi:hypothetical protein